MPNWCENKLLIKADGKDALEDFKKLEELFNETLKYDSKTSSVENLLNSVVPIPENIYLGAIGVKEREKYGDNHWYSWCNSNWGTKWDVSDCIMFYDPRCGGTMPSNEMRFEFLTAHVPPIPWLEKVGAKFPNLWLLLEYHEPGMMFKGVACGRGEIVDDYEEYE